MTTRKTTSKKSTRRKPSPDKQKGGKKAVGKGNGAGGARQTELDKLLEETLEEVEHFFDGIYDPETYIDTECTLRQMAFALEYMDNGFKQGPAYLKAVPASSRLSASQRSQRGSAYLKDPKVQRFIAAELHFRRMAAGVTHSWITKKYKQWAQIDPTEFFDIVKLGKSKRYSIVLKTELEDLPLHVRTSIKSLSVDPKSGSIKVELVDQKGALDQLSKLMGFTNDKLIDLDNSEVHLHFDSQDEDA